MLCSLCPRKCHIDRSKGSAVCGASDVPKVARAMLHHWEEPCISGVRGSGAVFFSGCNLGCVFCQNSVLHDGKIGTPTPFEALSDLFLSLEDQGAHNINLVTPTPHIVAIRKALLLAKASGLTIPVVYNTGSYERPESLRALEGLIDIYLPDYKYVSPILSERFSKAPDYHCAAAAAVQEMVRQVGNLTLDIDGMAKRGVLIRHLILPGCVDDTRRVLDDLAERYGKDIHLSLMRQYTPPDRNVPSPLHRKITDREYERCISYALSIGLNNIWIQEKGCEKSDFTPTFTNWK